MVESYVNSLMDDPDIETMRAGMCISEWIFPFSITSSTQSFANMSKPPLKCRYDRFELIMHKIDCNIG